MKIQASWALLPKGWARDVSFDLMDGRISAITPGSVAAPGAMRVAALIPGVANLHSHAFQRGFAGLTERRGQGRESFWTWREMMYRFALTLGPEDMQAIAEMAYVEMLEAGYTRVGEFHYLHHAPDGRSYDDPAELSARIFAAAETTGLSLTHLPVFYAHGGFGSKPPEEGQRRFLHDPDAFLRLVERCDDMARPGDIVGYAPHSLRAASHEDLKRLTSELPGRPVHIHVAEQQKEVDESLAHSGQRPVEWLLDHMPVDHRWCLIHATHLTEGEVRGIAASGATVGLCPITEANLGDGVFPGPRFMECGGRIGVGTDSNVRIDLRGELEVLEYGQRLFHQARNVLAPESGSTGAQLFLAALSGGARALGSGAGLQPGASADMVALTDPADLGSDGDTLIDRWVFGPDVRVSDVWCDGRHLVREGRHVKREGIVARHAAAVRRVVA